MIAAIKAWWQKKQTVAPVAKQPESKRMTMKEIIDQCFIYDDMIKDPDITQEKRDDLMKTRKLLEELKIWTIMFEVWSGKKD